MGTKLYEYDCTQCGDTVLVTEDPRTDDVPAMWCPPCSAVEIDYTVDPDAYDDPTIVRVESPEAN